MDHKLDMAIFACIGVSILATMLLLTAGIVFIIKALS